MLSLRVLSLISFCELEAGVVELLFEIGVAVQPDYWVSERGGGGYCIVEAGCDTRFGAQVAREVEEGSPGTCIPPSSVWVFVDRSQVLPQVLSPLFSEFGVRGRSREPGLGGEGNGWRRACFGCDGVVECGEFRIALLDNERSKSLPERYIIDSVGFCSC